MSHHDPDDPIPSPPPPIETGLLRALWFSVLGWKTGHPDRTGKYLVQFDDTEFGVYQWVLGGKAWSGGRDVVAFKELRGPLPRRR